MRFKIPQNLILYRRLIIAAGWVALAVLPIRYIRGSPGVDFNGDGTDDPGIFRPLSGLWAIRDITRKYYGIIGNIPCPADLDGNGTADIMLFRNGRWAADLSGAGSQFSYFGDHGDLPMPGDYQGDGTSAPAIFREDIGLWAIRGLTRAYFGTSGDFPLSLDSTGDGTSGIGIFRGSTGLWAVKDISRLYFGQDGDLPVAGDYNGDGSEEMGIFRPETGLWAIRSVTRAYFGSSNDIAVPGDYTGDGTCDIAVFRPTSGLWIVKGVTRLYFGSSPDCPLSAGYGSGLLTYSTIMICGDSCSGNTILQTHISHMLSRYPDRVLHTGDMVNYSTSYDWSLYTEAIAPVADILYPCPGNHESPFDIYYNIYSHLYSDISSLYYSFTLDNIHIVSLNSNEINQQQLDWLAGDLQSNQDSEWQFTFFHHPPYSGGPHGSDLEARDYIVPILENYNVDMVFNGHNHGYERTYGIKNETIDDSGVTYLVAAGGGAPLYPITGRWWTSFFESTYCYTEIITQGKNLQLKTYNQDNQEIDYLAITHP